MGNLILSNKPASLALRIRRSLIPALVMLFVLQSTTAVFSQVVRVTDVENFIPMEQVTFLIDGQELIQNSPEGNQNPSPEDVPVIISGIQIEGGNIIYAATRTPTVANPNPAIGNTEIRPSAIQIVRSDNTIISHRDPDFISSLEAVVSTPDIRSYWDINEQPSIPRGDPFVDLIYSDPVVTSGYLLYTERDGNSPTDIIALGRNGEPIEGANTIEVRGYQWKTGINHVSNVPEQSQEMVLFSPSLFESDEPIFGIRVIAVNEPDGKLVFFVNAISATPDLAERVNSELGGAGILNIFDNDELNGAALNPIDVILTILEDFPAGTAVLNSDGTVDVPPNTPPGVYTLTYEISVGQDSDQAEVRIEVIEYKPVAIDDAVDVPDSFPKDSILNVLDNDMLNGLPALIENVNLSEISNNSSGLISLTADGSIDIAEGIPSGNYLLVYQICDAADPGKCDQGTVVVTVAPTLLTAVDDTYGTINLNRGGTIGNVLENDLLNGELVPAGRVSVILLDEGGLSGVTLSPSGELELPVGLPDGDYELQYEMQENINPGNRDQAIIRFSLRDIQLEANEDEFITNQNQDLTLDVLANDFINTGELLVETLVIVQAPENGTLEPNGDGTFTYSPTVNFFGTDSFTYEICENEDRQFCDQAMVTIQVRPILLDLAKTSSSAELSVGGMVTYTIQLTNKSEFELVDIVVDDVLPNGLEFLSAVPNPEESGTWIIESLPQGSSSNITIEAMATDLGQVVNIATVNIGEYTDQVEALPVTVQARLVDVSISKSSSGIEIYEGNEFEYEIRLGNTGSNIANNITIEDILPDGLVYLGFSSEGFEGSPNVSGNIISWVVPSIEAGQEMVFRIQVQAIQVGMVSNTAILTLPEDQENLSADEEATDTNQVRPFFIPNVITPGKIDGKNDTFEVRGLQRFASSLLTILNRNGDHVYESDDYQNDWSANGLNGGSYYYVLVITDSQGIEQIYKGWIQVVK